MMRPSYTQSYENPGYPHSVPNYWGGYPQQMPYYQQPVQPYPYQMAGDHVMQKLGGQNLYQSQSFPEQPMTIGTNPGSTIPQSYQQQYQQPYQQQYQQPYFSQPQSAQPFNPFDNPLQPQVKRPPQQQYANPYPQQQFMQKTQPSGFKSVLNQFKTQDGSVDVTKMMNTAGQMVNTFSQMSSVVKGVGGLFKLKV